MKTIQILLIIIAATTTAFADVYIPRIDKPMGINEGKCSSAYHKPLIAVETAHTYDVQKYTFDLYIDEVAETIAGTVTVNMNMVDAGISQIELDLDDVRLTVSDCLVGGVSQSFTHTDELLTVQLGGTYGPGDNIDIAVSYSGSPSAGLYFLDSPVKICYTFTEPTDSKYWFPCYDQPSDKADEGVELLLNVRDDWEVASNGLLVQTTTPTPGRKVYHWLSEYSIAQYLIAFGATDYFEFSDSWEGMPLDYWVYPSYSVSGPISYDHVPEMMDCFKGHFGDYPFKNEKYGMYSCGINGAMEHQTNTAMRYDFADGGTNQRWDWLIAHELGHQWWGDNVTCGTWKDIWLNEGFATYSDALFFEYYHGDETFQQRMSDFADAYFNEDESARFPIYDPDIMWGATVYEKGSWILHMMRYEAGDTAFFEMLKYYRAQHEDGTAITAQFQQDVEDSTGTDWDWFFNQWVYAAGYPEFDWTWNEGGSGDITVQVLQVQEDDGITPIFQTHLDLLVETTTGTELFNVWVADADETFTLMPNGKVTNVEFDPNTKILCTHEHSYNPGPAGPLKLYQNRPNPVSSFTTFTITIPVAAKTQLNVFDISGRKIDTILDRDLPAGTHSINYDCNLADGVYIYQLSSGGKEDVKKMIVVN